MHSKLLVFLLGINLVLPYAPRVFAGASRDAFSDALERNVTKSKASFNLSSDEEIALLAEALAAGSFMPSLNDQDILAVELSQYPTDSIFFTLKKNIICQYNVYEERCDCLDQKSLLPQAYVSIKLKTPSMSQGSLVSNIAAKINSLSLSPKTNLSSLFSKLVQKNHEFCTAAVERAEQNDLISVLRASADLMGFTENDLQSLEYISKSWNVNDKAYYFTSKTLGACVYAPITRDGTGGFASLDCFQSNGTETRRGVYNSSLMRPNTYRFSVSNSENEASKEQVIKLVNGVVYKVSGINDYVPHESERQPRLCM